MGVWRADINYNPEWGYEYISLSYQDDDSSIYYEGELVHEDKNVYSSYNEQLMTRIKVTIVEGYINVTVEYTVNNLMYILEGAYYQEGGIYENNIKPQYIKEDELINVGVYEMESPDGVAYEAVPGGSGITEGVGLGISDSFGNNFFSGILHSVSYGTYVGTDDRSTITCVFTDTTVTVVVNETNDIALLKMQGTYTLTSLIDYRYVS